MAETHLGNLPQRPWQMVGNRAWRQGSWQVFWQNRNCQVKIYKKRCYSPVKLLHNSNNVIGEVRFFPNHTQSQVHSKYNIEILQRQVQLCAMSYLNLVQQKYKSGIVVLLLKPHLVLISWDLIQKLMFPTKVVWADLKEWHWPAPDAGSCSKSDRRGSTKDPC